MPRRNVREVRPAIHRGRLDKLVVYDVTEDELELLERGSPDSVLLNFAIATLSTFLSFLTSLLTTKFETDRLFDVFVIVCFLSGLSGFVLLVLWRRGRRDVSSLAQRIRRRLTVEQPVQMVTEIVDDAASENAGGDA